MKYTSHGRQPAADSLYGAGGTAGACRARERSGSSPRIDSEPEYRVDELEKTVDSCPIFHVKQ
jgi:hypothetical protein